MPCPLVKKKKNHFLEDYPVMLKKKGQPKDKRKEKEKKRKMMKKRSMQGASAPLAWQEEFQWFAPPSASGHPKTPR
jgi:hypothetical protein